MNAPLEEAQHLLKNKDPMAEFNRIWEFQSTYYPKARNKRLRFWKKVKAHLVKELGLQAAKRTVEKVKTG